MADIVWEFWYWWVAGLVFLVIEILAPGFFFVWLAMAAALTGAVVWLMPGLSFSWQAIIFSVFSIASILLSQASANRVVPEDTDHPKLNKRGEQYLGRVFNLHQAIENGQGKIKVDDTVWKVYGKDCGLDTKVKVIAVRGTVFDVEAVVEPVNFDVVK